jgi:hypothetical protein
MPPTFRSSSEIQTDLEGRFPSLQNTRWLIKSPSNDSYKCIAWAACRTDITWWPADDPFEDRIDFFIQEFADIGYEPSNNPEFEFGYQKVAIYTSSDRRVQHMARQHFLGRGWLSKCGSLEDILHPDLQCLEGNPSPWLAPWRSYGQVEQILKRSWWSAVINLYIFRCLWHAFKFWLYRLRHPSWIWNNIFRRG